MADLGVDFLLVGGGIASGAAAKELREHESGASILLVGREADPPYDRPPLSKSYLTGGSSRQDAYMQPEAWYREQDIDLRTKTSVMGVDLEQQTAKLQSKETVAYGKALVATGAMVNILRVDGAQLEGIHYLRAFGNADAIGDDTSEGDHIVLVGGSYIACECAASLTAQGRRCTMVMMEDRPLQTTLGEQFGTWAQDLLSGKGVELVTGAEVEAFLGSDGADEGRVQAVRTADGREISCDAVIVGSGVKPDIMVARKAGLDVDDGIVCDAQLRTSDPNVWAAGDVCRYPSPHHGGDHVRIEHWDLAFQQGRTAARNMLGGSEAFEEVPYFWSDLADWASLECVGAPRDWDRTVRRGDADQFTVFYLRDGALAGAATTGRSEDLGPARRLLADKVSLDDAKVQALGDPGADLSQLAD
ncbi:MAG: NAD(P)/FAD-dependent oxidoreductase [Solirubrobacterales bacterium]